MKHYLMSAFSLIVSLAVATEPASQPERISLWKGQAPVGEGKIVAADAFVTVYRPAKPNGAAVVICPGGAYAVLCVEPEGHGIAKWLNQHGITGIVLEYRLPHGNRFVPLLDAQRALRLARAKAGAWGLDPRKIGIMGFSAGGHLASTAATHFDEGRPGDPDPVERLSCRPDFAVLIYPVITMGAQTHAQTKRNLLGDAPEAAIVDLYSNEKQVTDKTPPTFLAHARDDGPVPPVNSRMFYDALQAHKVPGKYLELPNGGHGLNFYKGASWDAWQAQSLEWLVERKILPPPAGRPAAAPQAGTSASAKGDESAAAQEVDRRISEIRTQRQLQIYWKGNADLVPGHLRGLMKVGPASAAQARMIVGLCSRMLKAWPPEVTKHLKAIYIFDAVEMQGVRGVCMANEDNVYMSSYLPEYTLWPRLIHEASHVVNRAVPLDEKLWTSSLSKGVHYIGAAGTKGDPFRTDEKTHQQGFIVPYAQIDLYEEFAMLSQYIFCDPQTVKPLIKKYPEIRKRVALAIQYYQRLSPQFDFSEYDDALGNEVKGSGTRVARGAARTSSQDVLK